MSIANGAPVDLDFLQVELPRLTRRHGPLNVYQLLGLAGSELAADQTLGYFLDPRERHGMGNALVDALLSLLEGKPLLAAAGIDLGSSFLAGRCVGSARWRVERQVAVAAPQDPRGALSWAGIMDLYLTNHELNVAVIIENKIGAPLNNPLESYVRHALDERYTTVLLVVLAPYEHKLDEEHQRWVTRAITYGALFERMGKLSPIGSQDSPDSDLDVRRSLDLLEQFRELRERSAKSMGYSNDSEFVRGFRQLLSDHDTAIGEFFEAVQTINRLFRERSKRLEPLVRDQLEALGIRTDWESHSHQNARWVYAWNAYHLVDSDNSIELIMSPDPMRAGPITVKAYPGRTYKLYPEYDHITFGVDWQASDEEVAEAFTAVLRRLVAQHPRGS